jgi:hypothetical protein
MISYFKNDGDGHFIFKIKDNFFCILCDFWYPLKYTLKTFENGWSKKIE